MLVLRPRDARARAAGRRRAPARRRRAGPRRPARRRARVPARGRRAARRPGDARRAARGARTRRARDARRGKRSAARALARRALRLSPGDPRALLIEGEVLFVSGDREGARRSLSAALRRDRGVLTRAERFKACVKLRDWRRALALAGRILDDGPQLQDLRAFWDPWEWDERVPRAEREAEILSLEKAAGPASPWTLYYRGALAGPSALADFRRLARLPARRWAWMLGKAATTALWNGEFALAADWFERALSGGPADWRARAFRAETLLCLHRVEEAYAELERARAEAPPTESAQALAWLGAFDLWTGRYESALARLEEADRLGAMCAPCWKGGALLKLGRAEEALAVLDDALRRYPLDFEAYIWRGEAKRALGRHEAALADLGAIALPDAAPGAPAWLWALINRALCRRALGDHAGASADFRALPARVVEHVRAKRGLGPGEEVPILEAALELARGFRREEYGQAIWMD
ncbi:MAG: tetratricopeptide repeat protein [Elusimicrobiota bacterium]|nr:MAG: tetratricopeptide repeat protein [Elusimicrobiota bacterium]